MPEHARNGLDRSDTHDFGRHPGYRKTGKARQRLEVELLENLLRNEQHGTRTIGHLRAVAGRHRTACGKHRLEFGQTLQRAIRARPFVGVGEKVVDRHFAGFQIRHLRLDRKGRNFGLEVSGGNCRARLLMRSHGEGILVFTRYLPLLCHLLGGQPHAEGDGIVLLLLEERWIDGDLVAHHLVQQRHGFCTGSDHYVGFAEANAVGGHRHRLHAGGTEAVDGDARHRIRQTGQQQADTGNVHSLFGFGHGTADDDVFDQRRI